MVVLIYRTDKKLIRYVAPMTHISVGSSNKIVGFGGFATVSV